jgi:hypothetical protein
MSLKARCFSVDNFSGDLYLSSVTGFERGSHAILSDHSPSVIPPPNRSHGWWATHIDTACGVAV